MRRSDGLAKVTGGAKYTGDLVPDNAVHLAFVRSPVAHGILRSIDVDAALSSPGVELVLTRDNLEGAREKLYGDWIRDQPLLALDTVRYVGEPVAAVVANSRREAMRAAQLVDMDIEPLETLVSVEDALRPDAPLIHKGPYGYYGPANDRLGDCIWFPGESEDHQIIELRGNNCYETRFEDGDVEAELAGAAWVHSAVFKFPAKFTYPMEPHSVVAEWNDGNLLVRSSHQQPYKLREELAELLGLREDQIRVEVPYVGGSYGAKWMAGFEALVAEASRLSGRPASLAIDVEGAFQTSVSNAARVVIRTGVDTEGRIVARDVDTTLNSGAYDASGLRVAYKAGYRAIGPYRCRSFRSTSRAVYTNRIPGGAFRGFGGPQVIWAIESATDEIAHHLGMTPLEFRLLNYKDRGEAFVYAGADVDTDFAAGITSARKKLDEKPALKPFTLGEPRRRVGTGVATGAKDAGGFAGSSEASIALLRGGGFVLRSAAIEMGQGIESALRNIAAGALGCDVTDVTMTPANTDDELFDNGTVASRSLLFAGNAVADAVREFKATLGGLSRDGSADDDPQEWRFSEGAVHRPVGDAIPFDRLFAAAEDRGAIEPGAQKIVAKGRYEIAAGGEWGWRGKIPFFEVSHAAVRLAVDCDTGEIQLLDLVSVTDVGHAVHRPALIGQNDGCLVMAIGHSLVEHLNFSEDGVLMNPNIADYHVPKLSHLPARGLHTVLIENGDGPGYRGAKGASEGGILPVAPAIGNALFDAVGVRVRTLPVRPKDLWRAIRDGTGVLEVTDSAFEPLAAPAPPSRPRARKGDR